MATPDHTVLMRPPIPSATSSPHIPAVRRSSGHGWRTAV